MIKEFAKLVPESLLHKSGEVFFSGKRAFGAPSELYILGANPGGDPESMPNHPTIMQHIEQVLHDKHANWSAYRDERWYGRAPGKSQMQRRMRHLFDELGLDPGEVPCSEVVFLRSKDLSRLAGNFNQLAEECWPLHQAVIKNLSVRVVVCLGKRAGERVRDQLGAHTLLDEFKDTKPGYTRGWKSEMHKNSNGLVVVHLSHPSRAIWTDPLSDPTILVKRALIRTDTKHRAEYLARQRNFKPVRIKGEMISDTVIRDREDRVYPRRVYTGPIIRRQTVNIHARQRQATIGLDLIAGAVADMLTEAEGYLAATEIAREIAPGVRNYDIIVGVLRSMEEQGLVARKGSSNWHLTAEGKNTTEQAP